MSLLAVRFSSMRKAARYAKARTRRCRWEHLEVLENRMLLSAALDAAATAAAFAAPTQVRQMENLDRGVVVVRSSSGAFVSWRLLALDPSNIGFNVYRSANGGAAVKLNSAVLTAGTNYTDSSASMSVNNVYFVRPVLGGVEQAASGSYTLKANTAVEPCLTIPLVAPLAGYSTKFVWVGDLDGDGEYDFVIDRLAPFDPNNNDIGLGQQFLEAYKRDGTRLWSINMGPSSTELYNISPGAATLSMGMYDGADVYDLNGDGKAEVVLKVADGVVFPNGSVFTNADHNKQFLAILNGQTGNMLANIAFPTDFYAQAGKYGTQLAIGCLNGSTPSVVGWLRNRNADKSFNDIIVAWSWNGTALTQNWKYLIPSTASGFAGFHQMRIADVDGDGKDEILPGNYCLNGDGTLRYKLAGVGHGDRFYVGKFDPNRPGLQGYGIQQDNASGLLNYYFDASTGEVLWTVYTTPPGGDVGRGVVGDVDPNHPGYEVWAFQGMYNGPTGELLASASVTPWPSHSIWWDGDLLNEELNDSKLEQWDYAGQTVGRLVTLYNYETSTISGHNPMFMGDILGDWRTEIVTLSSDYAKLVIFTTDNPTSSRIYTMAQNPTYRDEMTVKGYYECPLLDYYMGYGMSTPPAPKVYYVSNDPSNAAPTLATPAAASPNPLTGSTTNLSVLGADDGGEANLIYNWSAQGPEPVAFSVNGVNSAKNAVATFTKAGTYYLTALISDAKGLSAISNVTVTISQTQSGITVSPVTPIVIATGTQQFTAVAYDQYGDPMSAQPALTWSVSSGVGTINSGGLYTAPGAAGSATVQVTGGGSSKTTTLSVVAGAPTLSQAAAASPSPVTGTTTNLSVRAAYVAGEAKLTYTWATTGTPPAPVTYSVNASNAAKNTVVTFTKAGTYSFLVTIVDQIGQTITSSVTVTVNQTMTTGVINPAAAWVLTGKTQQFAVAVKDQFGNAMASPPTFAWSMASGGGTINSSGLYTAPGTIGAAVVQAVGGGSTFTANVTILFAGNLFTNSGDIGTFTPAGSSTFSNGTYTIGGAGADVWGTADQFQFDYRAITGDVTIIARVASVGYASAWSKAGLMIRESTADNAKNAYLAVTPSTSNGITFQQRTLTGGDSVSVKTAGLIAPCWIKLVRSGDNFSAYRSPDGITWTQVSTMQTVAMNATVYVGLAVTSHAPGSICTAIFDNISIVSANAAPTVAVAASATPNPSGMTTNVSVLGADDGGEANLVYTWSAIGTPPAPVTFSATGTNAAKNAVATFTKAGTYSLLVTISDPGGLTVTSSLSVTVTSTIAGRYLFYSGSFFDGANHNTAIATDKSALLPGHAAGFANYSSYDLGINGLMIDIVGPAGTLVPSDFVFAAGNDNSPDGWTTLAVSPTVNNRPGAGVGGSTRVELVLPDNAVQNQWLKVTVKGGAGVNSGLTADDVFYFGNAIGETGGDAASMRVDVADQLNVRAAQTASALITSACDINRDGRVDSTDEALCRTHMTWFMSDLRLISPPAISGAALPAAAPVVVVAESPAALVVVTGSSAALAVASPLATPAASSAVAPTTAAVSIVAPLGENKTAVRVTPLAGLVHVATARQVSAVHAKQIVWMRLQVLPWDALRLQTPAPGGAFVIPTGTVARSSVAGAVSPLIDAGNRPSDRESK